ncbi:MAG TPA: DUF1552 domain-containing protein [Polyangiaceae bacterium]|jgi:hypothetical protein|nr:DUF1552 domain-containing protein [Polyangiaceae bacterium]
MTRPIPKLPGFSMPRFSRRNLLRGGLAATAAVPLLDARRLLGQTESATPPMRLLVVHTPNGTRNDYFWPSGSDSSYTLNEYTKPLAGFEQKLMFLKGIRHVPAVVGDNGFNGGLNGSEHARGTGGMLTARPLSSGNFKSFMATSGWGTGISIDQQIADVLDPPTTFKTLQLGIHVRDAEVRGRISYRGADQPVPPREDPSDVFDTLFGGALMGTASDGSPAEDVTLARLRAQRQSVFDLTKNELTRLEQHLGMEDKAKLEAHMDSIREIEKRLGGDGTTPAGSPAVGSAGCTAPSGLNFDVDLNDDNSLLDTGHLQMDLAAAALACDQTRIMTLQWSYSESEHLYKFLNLDRNHHAISHDWSGTQGFTEYGQIEVWLAEQMAYLLGKLDSYPEGDGTLLDNTIVFWATEIGESTKHDLTLMPYVLAGGGQKLRTGRLVDYGDTRHDNTKLLISLAQLMGAESITSFGDDSGAQDTLPDIT